MSLDIHRLKARKWENVFHASGNDRKLEIVIHILDTIHFKVKSVTRQRKALYNDKGPKDEDITIFLHICTQ